MEQPIEQPIEQPMEQPIDPLVADMVDALDAALREEFEERAAIIEFDGKQQRSHAECLALIDILRRHPAALTGVTVLQVEIDGVTQWLLITDLDAARQYLSDTGGIEIGVRVLADVIKEHFGGLAKLAKVAKVSGTDRLPAPGIFDHLV